jgi:hypothetical protein
MNPTDPSTSTLQEILTDNLLVDAYDPEGLADWCQRSYPALKICHDFRKQLLDSIQHPGLISPKTYEACTLDERFPTQDLLQSHLKDIWNICFPNESID